MNAATSRPRPRPSEADGTSQRFRPWAVTVLAMAVAYFVAGKLALLIAIPPGYATAIWPPAGLALAGVLLFGYRVWPGIWLGSFFVNATTGDGASSAELINSLAVSLGIGIGAVLQAILGAHTIRRFIGFPTRLHTEREVGSFLLPGTGRLTSGKRMTSSPGR